jgi:hypothetical protein
MRFIRVSPLDNGAAGPLTTITARRMPGLPLPKTSPKQPDSAIQVTEIGSL